MIHYNLTAFAIICSLLPAKGATIDSTPTWGGQDIGFIGAKGSKFVGQSFTVGTSTRLDQITFYLIHELGNDPLQFQIRLKLWDLLTNRPVGGDLFTSALLQTPGMGVPPVHPGFSVQPISIQTGGLNLLTDENYIAIISTINATGDGSGWVGYAGSVYDGGQSAFVQNGADPNDSWTTGFPDPGGDLAFQLAFNIPEPSVLLMTLISSACLMRRSRNSVRL